MTIAEIVEVARHVRRGICTELRQGRHPVVDRGTLCGACALASVRIAMHFGDPSILRCGRYFRVEELTDTTRLFRGNGHYWLKLDGTIIDATATQFGTYPAIAVLPPRDPRHRHYWTEFRGRAVLREAVMDLGGRENRLALWWLESLTRRRRAA